MKPAVLPSRLGSKINCFTLVMLLTAPWVWSSTNATLIPGALLEGSISAPGQSNTWTFTAKTGDAIIVRAGEKADTAFTPWLRLYGPSGAQLDSKYGTAVAEVVTRAAENGTFSVVVSDGSFGRQQIGDYRITLAQSAVDITVSAGDEGGPLTNGWSHTGTILLGDLDVWSCPANTGDALIIRAGQITANNGLVPWLRLYGPDGALLDNSYGNSAAEISAKAPTNGTYMLVIGDGSLGRNGSGDYRLKLARTSGEVFTAAGDQGGSLAADNNPSGTIGIGDLDIWRFTTCQGEIIYLSANKVIASDGLMPWIRLYGPSGNLLKSVYNNTTATILMSASEYGTYTLVIGDGSLGRNSTGAYQLTSNGLSDGFKLCSPVIAGAELSLNSVGGKTNANCVIYSTTNLNTPIAQWTAIATNQCDHVGVMNFKQLYHATQSQQYYRCQLP